MHVLKRFVVTLAFGALYVAHHATAAPGNSGNLDGLAGRVFLLEVTIESSLYPEYEGYVFPNCLTFEEDGTWIDLEFPGEGAPPAPGIWIQHTELPHITFTATAKEPALGWEVIVYGIANPGPGEGKQRLREYGMVLGEGNELIFYVEGEGYAVESCPL